MSAHPELVEGCVLCGKAFISSQALKPDTTHEGTQHPAPRTSHTASRTRHSAPRGAIDGLSIVAAVSGDRNLGMQEMGGEKATVRSALFVDSRANSAQQIALVAMASELSKGLVGTIVQVTSAPIQFADHGSEIQVSAGQVSLDVNKHLTHDPTCGAMQWFHPLASVDDAAIGVASQHVFTGSALGTKWSDPNKRSAFFGTFTY